MVLSSGRDSAARPAQTHGEGDEVLLGAVVQVPLDAGAFGLEGVHEGGAAGREVADLGGQLLEALLLALARQRLHQPQPQRSEPQEHPGGEGKADQPDG